MSNLSKIWPFSEAEWLTTALLVSGPLWLWRLTGLLTLASGTSCSEFGVTEEALVMKVNFSSQFGSSTSVVETFSFPFMFSYSTGLSFTCIGFVKLVHLIPMKWSLIRCIFLNVIHRLLALLWNRVWKISSSSWLSSRPSSSLSYLHKQKEYKNRCYVIVTNEQKLRICNGSYLPKMLVFSSLWHQNSKRSLLFGIHSDIKQKTMVHV